jgi:zinc transport system substrate-binding protein
VLVGVAALLAAGCTSALPSSVADAPVLSVVTGLWPLAQAAQALGGDKVAVDDLVPPGSNPLTFRPDASAQRIIQSAGLVLEAGDGLQPGFEAAAQGAPKVLAVAHQLGAGSPYVWLDPATMERAVGAVTDAMAAADPQAAALFRRNATGLTAEVESVRIDYSSTLSTCPGNTMVTPDRAFSDMAAAYSLTNLIIGPQPSASTVSDAKSRIEAGSSVAVVTQPWVDNRGVQQVAAVTASKLTDLDTLAGTPLNPPGGQNPYTQAMEQNLGRLSSALGCNNNEQ